MFKFLFGSLFNKGISRDDIQNLYRYILSREISKKEAGDVLKRINSDGTTINQLLCKLIFSVEFYNYLVQYSQELHLYFIHWARIQMVRKLLPPAQRIIDLGGANGSIYDLGYPYPFEKLTVIDLVPEERCDMYKNLEVKKCLTSLGSVEFLFRNFTDLSGFSDNSVDLVWSGQSIEHITQEESFHVFREIRRILRPEGCFCLDTPNRLLTEIHTAPSGGMFIHPEHKIEYYPDQLKKNLVDSGFLIEKEFGICEMKKTLKNNFIEYSDFFLGNSIIDDVSSAYIQFYQCRPAQ